MYLMESINLFKQSSCTKGTANSGVVAWRIKQSMELREVLC